MSCCAQEQALVDLHGGSVWLYPAPRWMLLMRATFILYYRQLSYPGLAPQPYAMACLTSVATGTDAELEAESQEPVAT